MTATVTETAKGAPVEGGVGRVSRIIGPVIDVEFPADAMPAMYNLLTVQVELSGETKNLNLEVVEADAAGSDTGLDFSVQSYEEGQLVPQYEFEPSADQVLDLLLPKYVTSRLFDALLQSAASELAARQRAMKSATDNAEELIRTYTRLANQSRQAEITQEISEIVGGVEALASAK